MDTSNREAMAIRSIHRYQRDARRLQLLAFAELTTTREEAQRALAEAAMLDAIADA